MAASVRIEDEAFSDPRMELLGSIAGYNRFEALGRMANLWRICTNRCAYVVSEAHVVACLGPKGIEAITQADLGEREADGIRIKGTRGRIEWLQSKREAGRKGGEAARKQAEAESRNDEAKRSRSQADPKQNEAEAKQTKANTKQTRSETKPLTPTLTLTPTLVPIPSLAEDIAATPPVDAKPDNPKPVKPRPRRLLWDAIVSITGADASIASVASHIGRVEKALKEATPPYTPEEVLALPEVAATQLPWAAGRVLTLGEVEKNMPLVRGKGSTVPIAGRIAAKPSAAQSTANRLQAWMDKEQPQ